ncbi:hypothetical protein FHL15_006675 [Xylaria flabelliformis]|uniref:Uncharacterized protein n=1 Tax=Xylaria flabelliformis TaxID=2512241 RepID=A0A553HX31_9PEZI|nr:hypothetical protein FHL15_006675 [Xylaria flabelliformis]
MTYSAIDSAPKAHYGKEFQSVRTLVNALRTPFPHGYRSDIPSTSSTGLRNLVNVSHALRQGCVHGVQQACSVMSVLHLQEQATRRELLLLIADFPKIVIQKPGSSIIAKSLAKVKTAVRTMPHTRLNTATLLPGPNNILCLTARGVHIWGSGFDLVWSFALPPSGRYFYAAIMQRSPQPAYLEGQP